MHHLFDRSIQELGYVIADFIVYTWRKVSFHFSKFGLYIFDNVIGITTIVLFQHDRSRRMPVQIGIDIKKFTPQFDFSHVF